MALPRACAYYMNCLYDRYEILETSPSLTIVPSALFLAYLVPALIINCLIVLPSSNGESINCFLN